MSLYNVAEQTKSTITAKALRVLEKLYAVDAVLSRPSTTDEQDVYGIAGNSASALNLTEIGTKRIIPTKSVFSDAGPAVFGLIEGQVIYTRENDMLPGDILEIIRNDAKSFKVKIIKVKSLGLTDTVMYQLEVTAFDI